MHGLKSLGRRSAPRRGHCPILSLDFCLCSVVSMSTLYVLSLRSEEDLVDIEG